MSTMHAWSDARKVAQKAIKIVKLGADRDTWAVSVDGVQVESGLDRRAASMYRKRLVNDRARETENAVA